MENRRDFFRASFAWELGAEGEGLGHPRAPFTSPGLPEAGRRPKVLARGRSSPFLGPAMLFLV